MATTLTIVPTAEHPSRLDPTAQAVWDGTEADRSRRHHPSVYRVRGGYMLTWSEPTPDKGYRGYAVLDLFPDEEEARSAWRDSVSKDVLA